MSQRQAAGRACPGEAPATGRAQDAHRALRTEQGDQGEAAASHVEVSIKKPERGACRRHGKASHPTAPTSLEMQYWWTM